jgi:hypothetical protein
MPKWANSEYRNHARMLDLCLAARINTGLRSKAVAPRFLLRLAAPYSQPYTPYFFRQLTPRKYQNTIESSYRLLPPRPPKTPAARFKGLYRN